MITKQVQQLIFLILCYDFPSNSVKYSRNEVNMQISFSVSSIKVSSFLLCIILFILVFTGGPPTLDRTNVQACWRALLDTYQFS